MEELHAAALGDAHHGDRGPAHPGGVQAALFLLVIARCVATPPRKNLNLHVEAVFLEDVVIERVEHRQVHHDRRTHGHAEYNLVGGLRTAPARSTPLRRERTPRPIPSTSFSFRTP